MRGLCVELGIWLLGAHLVHAEDVTPKQPASGQEEELNDNSGGVPRSLRGHIAAEVNLDHPHHSLGKSGIDPKMIPIMAKFLKGKGHLNDDFLFGNEELWSMGNGFPGGMGTIYEPPYPLPPPRTYRNEEKVAAAGLGHIKNFLEPGAGKKGELEELLPFLGDGQDSSLFFAKGNGAGFNAFGQNPGPDARYDRILDLLGSNDSGGANSAAVDAYLRRLIREELADPNEFYQYSMPTQQAIAGAVENENSDVKYKSIWIEKNGRYVLLRVSKGTPETLPQQPPLGNIEALFPTQEIQTPYPVPYKIPDATPPLRPYAIPQAIPQMIPQPQQVPQIDPQATPPLMPYAIPQATPQLTPQPQRIPQIDPQATPPAIPRPIPQATPQLTPQPQRIPQIDPQATPPAIPRPVPQATPQLTPQPQRIPQIDPQATPPAIPRPIPQATPQLTPQPQQIPQIDPQATPPAIPRPIPQATPQLTPQPQQIPQIAPQATPPAIPKPIPQATPQLTPQPQQIPQIAPQATPPAIPRPIPQATPQLTPQPQQQNASESLPTTAQFPNSPSNQMANATQGSQKPSTLANRNPTTTVQAPQSGSGVSSNGLRGDQLANLRTWCDTHAETAVPQQIPTAGTQAPEPLGAAADVPFDGGEELQPLNSVNVTQSVEGNAISAKSWSNFLQAMQLWGYA